MDKRKRIIQGILWIALYLLLTFIPLFALLFGPVPPRREFWREFSVALGFAALAMISLQFAVTARIRRMKAPYGSDIVYYFHKQISIVAFIIVIAHPILLFIFEPETINLLNLIQAPWRARMGVTGLVLLILLIITSVWRKQLKIEYYTWRIAHGIMATLAVGLSMGHIIGVGYYTGLPWKRALWIGYAIFWVGLLAYVRIVKPWLELRKPYVVEEVIPERGNTWTLVLKPQGHKGISFHPGQFAWLSIRHNPYEEREHPFSISSSAEKPEKLSFTIKELGDFTATIKDVSIGETVYLDGPHGAFGIDRNLSAPGFVFIAGGVGITPMMSMLRTLADRGDQRPLILIYANKVWEDVTFREEVESLQSKLNLKVVWVLEKPPSEWAGEKGFVTTALLESHLPAERDIWDTYICGPEPMMDAVENSLKVLGIPAGQYHSERFNLV